MSTSVQSRRYSRGGPHPTFDSYDLAQPAHARGSYRNEDDMFDTIFPQPPPRSRLQAERLARPSLPSLKAASLQVESADSSRSTARLLSSSYSIESVNSLASYPSSTSSLSLLHSLHPNKQGSTDSATDYYSPAISDINSADTDNSVCSDRVHSQSSDLGTQDQSGPLTPLTPNGPPHTWKPKELSLARKLPLPSHSAPTPSSAIISGDRNALLVGLGLSDLALDSSNSPLDATTQPTQGRSLLPSRSPHLGPGAAFPRDAQDDLTTSTVPSSGPKQLFLASSGGPPASRRFPGRRPSEGLHEAFISQVAPAPSEASSRSNTPQMRSAIPIMPNGPTFVSNRSLSPDPSSLASVDKKAGISAEEFLAQIASTPEYQASQYFESAASSSSSAWATDVEAQTPAKLVVSDQNFIDQVGSSKLLPVSESNTAVDHSHDQVGDETQHPGESDVGVTIGTSVLPAQGPGFSSQRSRAASLSGRKAPPTPLVLTSSPASSNAETLPGSAGGQLRRSQAATTDQNSPLSVYSDHSTADAASTAETPTTSASGSRHRQEDSMVDYSQLLHWPSSDIDSGRGQGPAEVDCSPSCEPVEGSTATTPQAVDIGSAARRDSSSSIPDQLTSHVISDRMTDSPEQRFSTFSSRVHSLRSETQDRQSAGSDSATAFEFAHLETSADSEGLSLTTMMGFLQRPNSQPASHRPRSEDAGSKMDGGCEQATQSTQDSALSTKGPGLASDDLGSASPAMSTSLNTNQDMHSPSREASPSAPAVPSFRLSISEPGQSASRVTMDPTDMERGEGTSALAPHSALTARPRKMSIVPDTPTFAIRDASWGERPRADSRALLPSIADGVELPPAPMTREHSHAESTSRWSSGSESEGESIKGARKSLSKSRKSFSASRKNSMAAGRDGIETSPESAIRPARRSSKTRAPGPGEAATQVLPVPTKTLVPSLSKRLLLNGLPSLRKKSFSNLSGQSASPSTPSSSRGPVSAGPSFSSHNEFPFPSADLRQPNGIPPLPSMPRQPSNRNDAFESSVRTAFATTFASSLQHSLESPRTPVSAPGYASSNDTPGPLTTQQILAQARNNVWPENYIGNGVSAAGLSSPYLSVSQDAFNPGFAPSRLAPIPPRSAPATRLGWSTAPHTPSTDPSARFFNNATQDKPLPPPGFAEAFTSTRSRSRTGEIAPPSNLRHLRQSSSSASLNKLRKDVANDAFRSRQASAAPVARPEEAVSSAKQSALVASEEQLPTISESAVKAAAAVDEPAELMDVAEFAASIPVLVDRQQAKMKKARRIRQQQDRFARRNSWTEFGLQWIAEQAADAFDVLAAEGLPSSAILIAAGGAPPRSDRVLTGGMGGSGGDGDSDGSDTDDYGSSDGGGGAGGGSGFGGSGGAGGGRRPGFGGDDADNSEDEESDESDEEEAAEALTGEDSEDEYGAVEPSNAARAGRRGVMPTVPARNASMPAPATAAETAADSDSSDDRPLGQLVDDPKALQKALRAKERKRHFDLAANALEGKGSSSATPSTSGHSRRAVQQPGKGAAVDAVMNPNELSQRLNKVQQRRERAQAPNAAVMHRSQTVARQEGGRPAAAVSRSKSVRTAPAERYAHPGMRARTPSEAALRAKAMAQGPSPISPTLASVSKMPELPSNAMATVVAAQKAMALAQANPTPAAMAQAQALATSATAALNAATAHVRRGGPSPVTATFNHGPSAGQTTTSPRMPDGVELPSAARRHPEVRGQTLPVASSAGSVPAVQATASAHQPGMLQRLRSRSVSRNQAPLTINTAAAPPLPDLPRPSTASKDSQASNSPRSAHIATFAALSQAAAHHGRPSVESQTAHGEVTMQRMASTQQNVVPASSEPSTGPSLGSGEPLQPHKVFILSRQRFTVVEVPVSARARDLALEVVERERLPMDEGKGGWIVFDCSAQFGIERPLREYEMITDVVNVRAHPKTDFLLIKRTELSPYLSLRSVPISSPALAGWVYVQDRKKKWNKRWLELRDHGLYHAKNEKGKDEMPICQISSFDVYLVDSSAVKMPKVNGFALRSQDPITMFEKPDQDYVHYFSLTDPAAHRDWVRAILNARSYILRQEKAILFQVESPLSSNQDAPLGAGPAAGAGGLSRKNTSYRPHGRPAEGPSETGHNGSSGPSPPNPLIDSSAFAGPFAKGSLLADKAINDAKEALRGHAPGASITGAFNELSLMDRNALRANEARRREEAVERQRRMKAEGQPLIDLVRK